MIYFIAHLTSRLGPWALRSTLLKALALSALVFAACGDGSDSPQDVPPFELDACLLVGEKVFGGSECFPGASPVVRVELVKPDTTTALCSGSVIGQHAVLTAAHCLLSDVIAARVFAGGRYVSVSSFVFHPQVSIGENVPAEVFYDVAVLFTSEQLTTRQYPLLFSRSAVVGEEALVAGYGRDENGTAGFLKVGNTFVSEVNEQYVVTEFLPSTANPCEGDSGGPLLVVQDGVLAIAGIVSSGTPDKECREGDVTLFVNIGNPIVQEFLLTVVEDASVL